MLDRLDNIITSRMEVVQTNSVRQLEHFSGDRLLNELIGETSMHSPLQMQQQNNLHTYLASGCVVCGDFATGRHYGVSSCEGCKGFFKRSVRKQLNYPLCPRNGTCEISKTTRNRCQYCRWKKCVAVGMRVDTVQNERKPLKPSNTNATMSTNPGGAPGQGQQRYRVISLAQSPRTVPYPYPFPGARRFGTGLSDMASSHFPFEFGSDSSSGISTEPTSEPVTPSASPEGPASKLEPATPSASSEGSAEDEEEEDESPSQVISEYASQLLFINVQFLLKIPQIRDFPSEVHFAIVKSCWCELFTFGLLDSPYEGIVPFAIHNGFGTSMAPFAEFMETAAKLEMDDFEYVILKLIIIFNPKHAGENQDVRKTMEDIRTNLLEQLIDHIKEEMEKKGEPDVAAASLRLSKLMLLLADVRPFTVFMIEEAFYSPLRAQFQHVTINTIIDGVVERCYSTDDHDDNEPTIDMSGPEEEDETEDVMVED